MDAAISVLVCLVSTLVEVFSAMPPSICFQQFKWEDCGAPPKAVIYYYKSGSRCEVGMWRGCLPNPNMFADEYECVQTCIFSLRAKPHNYHNFQDNIIESVETTAADQWTPTEDATTTATGSAEEGNTGTGEPDGGAAEGEAEGAEPQPEAEGGAEPEGEEPAAEEPAAEEK